jgi:hypothetical protein
VQAGLDLGSASVAHILPDIFNRIEMPSGLIDEKDGVAATALAISARCRFLASVLQAGRIKPAALPSFGRWRRRCRSRRCAVLPSAWTSAALGDAEGPSGGRYVYRRHSTTETKEAAK